MESALFALSDLYTVNDPLLLWGLVVPLLEIGGGLCAVLLLPPSMTRRMRGAVVSVLLGVLPVATIFYGLASAALRRGLIGLSVAEAAIGACVSVLVWSRRGRDLDGVDRIYSGAESWGAGARIGAALALMLLLYCLWMILR